MDGLRFLAFFPVFIHHAPVLLNFAPDCYDQSLAIALQAWNGMVLSGAPTGNHGWWAVYLEKDFAEGLKALDPNGRVIPLPEDLRPNEPMALFIRTPEAVVSIPTEDTLFHRWRAANKAFEPVVRETIGNKEGLGRFHILKALESAASDSRGDRVLEALYALRLADYFHTHYIAGRYHPEILGPGDVVSLRRELLVSEVTALRKSVAALDAEPARSFLRDGSKILEALGSHSQDKKPASPKK